MSGSVDTRVVKMELQSSAFEAGANRCIDILNNLQDSLQFKGASTGIDEVQKAVNGFDMESVENAVEEASGKFASFKNYVSETFWSLVADARNFGAELLQNLTLKPVMDGLGEYQTQMGSVQTILANSRDKLKAQGFTTEADQVAEINAHLDELNEYADKTIYNFSEMTRNIGTFTAAGVDLDLATRSIKGIANLAAASGSTSQQASTAMYQLSQAISTGTVKLQDWNSVVNAGMGGELFQEALKRTARVHGVAVDDIIAKQGSFRDSLHEGWLTSDILTETLDQLSISYEEVGDEAYRTAKANLENAGYSEQDAIAILELAKSAEDAATKVRTWNQLIDTIGEALGSGWATTWRLIVGDFLEATELFSEINSRISGLIEASQKARIAVLESWGDLGGRLDVRNTIFNLLSAIEIPLKSIATAFADTFGITGAQLKNVTAWLAEFSSKLIMSEGAAQFLYDVFRDVFTIIHSVIGVGGNLIRVLFNFGSLVLTISKPLFALGGIILKGVVTALAFLSEVILAITDHIEGFIKIITGGAINGINKFYKMFELIGKVLSDTVKKAKELASSLRIVINGIGAFVIGLGPVQTLIGAFSSIGDTIKSKVSGAFDTLKSKIFGTKKETEKLQGVATKFSTPYEQALTVLESAQSKVNDFVDGFAKADDKIKYTKDALDSFADSVKAKFDSVKNSIADMFGNPQKLIQRAFFDGKFGIITIMQKILGDEDGQKAFRDIFGPINDYLNNNREAFSTWSGAFDAVKKNLLDFAQKGIGKLPKPLAAVAGSIGIFGVAVRNLYASVKNWVKSTGLFDESLTPMQRGAKFVESLKDKIKSTIETLKTITPKDVFRVFVKTMADFRDQLNNIYPELAGLFDIITEDIATFMKLTMQNVDSWPDFFSRVKDLIVKAISDLPGTVRGLFEHLVGSFTYAKDNLTKEAGKLSFDNVRTNIGNFVKFVRDGFTIVTDFIKDVPGKIKEHFGLIVDNFEEFINNLPIDKLSELGTIISKIGLAITIRNFIKSITDLNNTIGSTGKKILDWPKSFGDALSRFGEGFNAWKKETKADAVVKIAAGIAILAGSLFLIASIPADDLIRAGKAMGIMAGAVAGIMAIAALLDKFKMINPSSLASIGDAIKGLGIGMVALAAAAWIFAQIPDDQMLKGVGSVFIMSLGVAAFAKALGDNGSEFKKGSKGLVFFSLSILILVKAVKALGEIGKEKDVLEKGVIALAAVIGVLTLFGALGAKGIADLLSAFLKFGAGVLLLTISFTTLAGGIAALSVALKKVDNLPLVIGTMVGSLVAFIVVCKMVESTDPMATSKALLVFAAALGVIALSFVALSTVPLDSMIASMFGIGLSLVAFGAMVKYLDPKDCQDVAGAILEFSAAIGIMSISISYLAKTPWTQIAAGTLALVALMGTLAVIHNVTKEGSLMATAEALIAFSVAIGVMALSFRTLEGVNFEAILPSLVAIGVSFLAFAGLSSLLAPFAAVLPVIGAGLITFSGAVLILAAAFWVIADAIQRVSSVGPDQIVSTFQAMGDGAGAAFTSFISHIPEWISTIVNMIKTEAPKFLAAGVELVMNFIGGIVSMFGGLLSAGGQSIGAFLSGIFSMAGKLLEIGRGIIGTIRNGIGEKIGTVLAAGQIVASKLIEGLRTLAGGLKNAALTAIDAMLGGIGGKIGSIFDKGAEIGNSLLGGIKGFLGIQSPSTAMAEVGRNSGEGLLQGLNEYMEPLGLEGQQLGDSLLGGLEGVPELFGQTGTDSMLSLQNGLASMQEPVAGTAAGLGDTLSGAFSGFSDIANTQGSEGALAFVNSFSGGAGKAKSATTQMTNAVLTEATALKPKMRTKANEAMNAFCSGISAAAGRARSASASVMNAAASGIGSLWSRFYNVGKSAADGLAAGIYAGLGAARVAADRLMAEAEKAAKAKAQINSPSKVFIGIGESLGEGLVDGIGNSKSPVSKATAGLAGATFDSFKSSLSTMSVGLDDLLETDYNPVITPVIDSTEFDSSIGRLTARMNALAPTDLSIGTVNYNQEFASKLSDYANTNRQAIEAVANNAIDYDILGASVANALVRSGVRVQMDSGEFVGYLAGEIRDVRRMYM